MKMKRIWMILLVLLLLTGTAGAEDALEEQAEALELEKLEDAAGDYLDGVSPTVDISLDEGLRKILEQGKNSLSGVLEGAVRSGVLLLVVALLCSVAEGLYMGAGEGMLDVVSIAGALAITAIAVSDVTALIGMGREAIDSMEQFSKVLLPTMAAVTAAGGAPSGAAVRQLATLLFSDLLLTLLNRLLLPLVYAYVAACTAHAAVGNDGLKRIAGTLKWVVTTALATVLLAFVGYLTVSGVIAGSVDAVTIKAAKFTVSSMVPVVGGILSDAAETVLAGAGILKNAVGVFGMLVVLSMCIVPFLHLGVHYLTYKAAAALAATISGGRVGGLIDGISGAFGLVLGMTGGCALVLLVSMVSAISMVTG